MVKSLCDYHAGELVLMMTDLLLFNTVPMTTDDLARYFKTTRRNVNAVLKKFRVLNNEFGAFSFIQDKRDFRRTYILELRGKL